MPGPRLLSIITAMMLVASGSGVQSQQYTIDQLREIETLIVSKDLAALWRFMMTHPQILRGNDPLALELRELQQSFETGSLSGFNYRGVEAARDVPFALAQVY